LSKLYCILTFFVHTVELRIERCGCWL